MSQVLYVSADRRDRIIADAARRKTPVVLTRRGELGWKLTKARFVGCDQPQGRLFIKPPADEGDVETGELMGVAFRSGHKKCMFNSVVADPTDAELDAGDDVAPITLCWPQGLQELQRRVYERACPPPGRRIKVSFCRTPVGSPETLEHLGLIEDISAGGVRVRSRGGIDLDAEDQVRVAFALRQGGPEFALDAVFRHCESRPDGFSSLGFQFVGLETSRQGQETLVRLARTVTDFQRTALRRKPGQLHPVRRGR